jgi:hypothetical protein
MNLETLDTVIGFAIVILLLSLVITSVVQLVGFVLRLREKALLWGVARVLEQLGVKNGALSLAQAILQHDSINPTKDGSATAIHFDEFIAIVKAIAAEPGDQVFGAKTKEIKDAATEIAKAIQAVPTPELLALAAGLEGELSQAFPQDVARVKEAAARAKAAAVEVGSKVRFWFDTVMDRTTERFVTHTRLVTVIAAVLLAGVGRIESLQLLKQLSQKSDVRAKLVQMTASVQTEAGAIVHPPQPAQPTIEALTNQIKSLQGDLAQTSLQIVPLEPYSPQYYWQHWPGLLISAFFLSLGAPFWFNTLRQLSNLRPILAGKIDAKDAAADD